MAGIAALLRLPLRPCCKNPNIHYSESNSDLSARLYCRQCKTSLFNDLFRPREELYDMWNRMILDRKKKEDINNIDVINYYPFVFAMK